jgi:hypothetical protein
MPQPPTDFAEYARPRARALWITSPFALLGGLLLYPCIRSLPTGGPPNPLGMIPFVMLCVLVTVGWRAIRDPWRRCRAARPLTQRLDPVSGEIVTDADATPGPHRGLSGLDEPPKRW